MSQGNDTTGRYSYDGLDRLLHEKARLGILTCLVAHPEGLLFNDLKEMCSLTDGNLSRHLQVLRQHQLVEIWKGFENRRPQTLCRLSLEGRERFLAYLAELEKVLKDVGQAPAATGEWGSPVPNGWVPA